MLELIICLCAVFLAGYLAGKRAGYRQGFASGSSSAPLLLREQSLDQGRCCLCQKSIDQQSSIL